METIRTLGKKQTGIDRMNRMKRVRKKFEIPLYLFRFYPVHPVNPV
jgi:hypothetical protein